MPAFVKRLVKLYDEQYGESSEEEDVAQVPAPSQGQMHKQGLLAVRTSARQDLVTGWKQPCSMHWAKQERLTSV